jgi:hypothetical protein
MDSEAMGSVCDQSDALLTGRAAWAVVAAPLLALLLWRIRRIRIEFPGLRLWACALLGVVFTVFDLLG